MAKQIVANNGELPPSVNISVAIKPIPNVGAKDIRSLPRGLGACAAKRTRGSTSLYAKQSTSTGAEYDGVSDNSSLLLQMVIQVENLIL